jgi:hypothetical protein
MVKRPDNLPESSRKAEVDAFLAKLQATPPGGQGRGRLIFAMDATASREPTWAEACRIQNEMFTATAALGGLEVQLVFYRGFDECKASGWLSNADALVRRMMAVRCLGGQTQLGKVLGHAAREAAKRKIGALVFVGDCMEEDVDAVCARAGELGLLGVPAFMFHQGDDPVAARAFQQIAKLTGGACCRFDSSSADQLKRLLGAVAAYVAGGAPALEDYGRRTGVTLQLSGRRA